MTKIAKIIGNTFLSVLEYVLIFIIAFAFFIRTEVVQTFLAQKVTHYLTELLAAEVSIERVAITFIDKAFLDGILVMDQHNDTLLYAKELYVNFGGYDAATMRINVDEVRLSSTTVKLKKYLGEEHLNFQFIIDAFKSAPDTSKAATDFEMNVTQIELVDSRFVFDNQQIQPISNGIDYAHLDITNLQLLAYDAQILPGIYSTGIEHLSAYDKSGIRLKKLSALARFDDSGLSVKDMLLELPNSSIAASTFDMRVNQLADFSAFIDRVNWNVHLESSHVSLKDVSYFVPTLEGMDAGFGIAGYISESIAGLRLSDFNVAIGDRTYIAGDFTLPDFRNPNEEIWLEHISELHISMNDIQGFRLPDNGSSIYLVLPDQVSNLGYVAGEDLTLKGNLNGVTMSLNRLTTGLGSLTFDENLVLFKEDKGDGFYFTSADSQKNYIHFELFDLGRLLGTSELGVVDGAFGFDAKFIASKTLKIQGVHGLFSRFDAAGYSYKNVVVQEADYDLTFGQSIPKSTLNGYISIRDENLDLTYSGRMEIKQEVKMDFSLDIECAHLNKLHPTLADRGELNGKMKLKGRVSNINELEGILKVSNLTYEENQEAFDINELLVTVERNTTTDRFQMRSDVVDIDFNGLVDLSTLSANLLYQGTQIFPAFFAGADPVVDTTSQFEYAVLLKQLNPVLNVFSPNLEVSEGTQLFGRYNGGNNTFDLTVESDYVNYQDYSFRQIYMFQELYDGQLLALYDIRTVNKSDSLAFQNLHFTNIASNNFMDANMQFEDAVMSKSNIEWYTHLLDNDVIDIDILPSYVSFNKNRWELENKAHINYSGECFFIEDFDLRRNDQLISANGQLSDYEEDKLNVMVSNLDLEDMGAAFFTELNMKGIANIDGFISNPFKELVFDGTATIDGFYLNEREVGNVLFSTSLNAASERMEFDGELIYKSLPTFNFSGDYWYRRTEENIDFDLLFRRTDIAVLNEFLDPDVVSDIAGELVGEFKLLGSIQAPEFNGKVKINRGNVKVGLLGTSYKYNGVLTSDDFGVLVDHMPITDEEGNTGSLTGMISHDHFTNFDYDISINMEEHPTLRNPVRPSEPLLLDKFLVLKTKYEEGSVYYGSAYVTGTASISGFNDKMDITVNAKTKRGTWIDFPMYGPTTVSEDGFISFKTPNKTEEELEQKIDFSGVKMNLNFDVTPDARVKLIFDPNIGDEITATGGGKISIGLDKYGDITMDGTYTLSDGMYNFALGPYKQNFVITPGGTIQWMGTPYDAQLDVRTYYRTVANLTAVMPDVIENRASDNEEIYSYLILNGDMNSPEISFDMEAPKASEAGKAVMNRIRSDQDELNRQFFSIMIMKRFLPLAGQESRGGAGGNALVDLVSTQINSILSKVSNEYQMKVDIDSDDVTGEGSVEFGVSKGFFDDKLLVSTSLGVGNQGTANEGAIIGDVSVEYLLNEDGTFRVNVFNRSNTTNTLEQNNQGPLTQGVGINYKEDFHNIEDFKLIQFIFDVFRKEENRKVLGKGRSKKLTPIPEEIIDQHAIKEEE